MSFSGPVFLPSHLMLHTPMKLEIEIPDKYGQKLDELEAVEPTIHDQIEVEVLPQILRLINETHRQLEERDQRRLVADQDTNTEN